MRGRLMAFLVLALPAALSAQARAPRQREGAAPPGDSAAPRRANLERQVRERMARVTKERLDASDEQMAKLEATNRKYDEKRRILVEQERDIRMSLRDEMLHPDSARQGQIAALLDRVIKVQRQRVDVSEQEQKELSGFLTPLQRAKYFALEQQVRQRMQQMRNGQPLQGRGGRGRGAGAPFPPGRARGRGVQPPPPGQ